MTTEIQVPVHLRSTFCRIEPNIIKNYDGPTEVSYLTEEAALSTVMNGQGGSLHFLTGDNMFAYVYKMIKSDKCSHKITFVVPGLRNLYWNHRKQLSDSDLSELKIAMNKPEPTFHDIFVYDRMFEYKKNADVSEYQIIGSITPFDVVHLPMIKFVYLLNNKGKLLFKLMSTNVILELQYEKYDFWDNEYNKLLENIEINSFCNNVNLE